MSLPALMRAFALAQSPGPTFSPGPSAWYESYDNRTPNVLNFLSNFAVVVKKKYHFKLPVLKIIQIINTAQQQLINQNNYIKKIKIETLDLDFTNFHIGTGTIAKLCFSVFNVVYLRAYVIWLSLELQTCFKTL